MSILLKYTEPRKRKIHKNNSKKETWQIRPAGEERWQQE